MHSTLPHEDSEMGKESEVYSVSAIDKDSPITAKDIGKAILHWEHPGICAMKAIARTCVRWPKMDEEIER